MENKKVVFIMDSPILRPYLTYTIHNIIGHVGSSLESLHDSAESSSTGRRSSSKIILVNTLSTLSAPSTVRFFQNSTEWPGDALEAITNFSPQVILTYFSCDSNIETLMKCIKKSEYHSKMPIIAIVPGLHEYTIAKLAGVTAICAFENLDSLGPIMQSVLTEIGASDLNGKLASLQYQFLIAIRETLRVFDYSVREYMRLATKLPC